MQTLPIQVDLDLNGEGWGYRARKARAALERELAAAKARMESEATARGLKRMPPPRKPEHYVWIAEAIVLGLSSSEIANRHSDYLSDNLIKAESTIRMANKATAKLLGFDWPTRALGAQE